MKPRACFLTGTDTGIGKTWVTLGLMSALRAKGQKVVGMKPVASGCRQTKAGLRNEDAESICQASTPAVSYDLVNPYAFEEPVAPHAAAEKAGVEISIPQIQAAYHQLCKLADVVVVEGVGGWRVPLSRDQGLVDLVKAIDVPVILVVGLKLGCINHALLSCESLVRDNIQLLGWVANQVEADYPFLNSTMQVLRSEIPAPLLGQVPYLNVLDVEEIGQSLQCPDLV